MFRRALLLGCAELAYEISFAQEDSQVLCETSKESKELWGLGFGALCRSETLAAACKLGIAGYRVTWASVLIEKVDVISMSSLGLVCVVHLSASVPAFRHTSSLKSVLRSCLCADIKQVMRASAVLGCPFFEVILNILTP